MEVIRIVMIGITGMLLGLLLKGTRPEYTVYLSLGAGICIFSYMTEVDVKRLTGTSDMKKVMDMKGNPLLLFINSWSIGMTLDRNEGLKLAEFSRN